MIASANCEKEKKTVIERLAITYCRLYGKIALIDYD